MHTTERMGDGCMQIHDPVPASVVGRGTMQRTAKLLGRIMRALA